MPASSVAPPVRLPQCRCGSALFRENTVCLSCGLPVGCLAERNLLVPFEARADGVWIGQGQAAGEWKPCGHRNGPHGCNWMLPADSPESLCLSCRTTRTLPNLSFPNAAEHWERAERAKRLVIAQLLRLGVPVRPKPQREDGVCFDFLEPTQGAPPVMTGHQDGVITLNLNEADPSSREAAREQMGESYRTLTGHIRHELAHYYWTLLEPLDGWTGKFRDDFGDERADYGGALRTHHQNGAPADWAQRHISAYASSHPWEDWAETFAHYLHIDEALHTSVQLGINPDRLRLRIDRFDESMLEDVASKPVREAFLRNIHRWVRLSLTANEINTSLGHPHAYPFVLNPSVVRKLCRVHTSLRLLRKDAERVAQR